MYYYILAHNSFDNLKIGALERVNIYRLSTPYMYIYKSEFGLGLGLDFGVKTVLGV